MPGTQIAIVQGHPDPASGHFGRALADAYARGAEAAGHAVRRIEVASLEFPVLRAARDFGASAPDGIRSAQEIIQWARHLLIVFPLWHGNLPAYFKAFVEQVFRPGFALAYESGRMPRKLLGGRSARVVVTMGMPAAVYRWYFGAHGVRALERSTLRFSGIRPVSRNLVGTVEGSAARRQKWLATMERLGRQGR